jgi:uridine phosphorylase
MHPDLPLLEFDADPAALIEPLPTATTAEIPDHAVICFFQEVIDEVCGDGRAERIGAFRWEHGTHPLYRLRVQDRPVAVFYPGVGAPLACGLFEDAIASGCSKFVACGGAGAIVPGMALGHVIVPSSAVRDEGTSCHYVPAGREIDTDPSAVAAAVAVLQERDVPHAVGKTWTTDAPYRETRAKIRARRAEGCLTVEMETAAFLAVARHRGVRFAQYLYAGDDASGETWDHRHWQTSSARRELFWLAASAVLRL